MCLYEETLTRFPWVILISKMKRLCLSRLTPWWTDTCTTEMNFFLLLLLLLLRLYHHHHHNRGGLSGNVLVRVIYTSALWQQTRLCTHHTRWAEWHRGPSGAFWDSPGQEAVQGQHPSHYWWHQGRQCCSLQLSVSWMIQSSGFRRKHWSLCSGQYKAVWYGSLPSSG